MLETEVADVKTEKATQSKSEDFSEMIDLYFGNWFWRAVHALIEHPKFKSSPQWIAETLSISVEEAVDALEGLEELGLVKRIGDRIEAKGPSHIIPEEKSSKEYAVKKHKQISQQILACYENSRIEGTMAHFVAADKEKLYKVLRDVFKTFETLNEESKSTTENAGVYAISLTCANIAPSLGGGK